MIGLIINKSIVVWWILWIKLKMQRIEMTLKEICKGGHIPEQILTDINKIKQLDAQITGTIPIFLTPSFRP
jgi:hypothetical protein